MISEKCTLKDVIACTLEALEGAGLKPSSLWGYHRDYLQLVNYCQRHGTTKYDFDLVDQFKREKDLLYESGQLTRSRHKHVTRSIRVLVEHAQNGELLSTIERQPKRFVLHDLYEEILQEYLRSTEFHPKTEKDVSWAVRRFLFYLEQSSYDTLHCVTEAHVRRFILLLSERLSTGGLRNMMSYLKGFGKFAYEKGYMEWDMTPLLSAKIRREQKIPSTLTDDELEKILAQIDTTTGLGKRDMAMIMLAITTGLRAIDIINLKLCDIDWLRGEIRLVQKKTLVSVVLPLMPEAGATIRDYILNGRPESSSEYIFLTTRYPIQQYKDPTTLGYMFSKYQSMAGIERQAFDGKGFHSLRRKIATKMVVSGVPVTTISQVLGQLDMESAKQYLSFDTENLRRCAISLAGIEVSGGDWDE